MKEKIKNFILNVNVLKRVLGYGIFSSLFFKKFKLKINKQVPHGKVLVLAPHTDDEVFGCGGALKLHTLQKDPVKIVYLTSLSRSRKKRQKEAEAATKILSISDLIFLNNFDGKLAVNKKTVLELVRIIKAYQPRIIYVPTFLDPHPDHLNTAKILAKALEFLNYQCWIFSYEIWSPIYVNRLVIIDKVLNFKKRAIKIYKSQLKDRPYLQAILGLNQYRAKIFDIGNYAEGFFVCDTRTYLRLINKLLK
jgi:LmbE family N-acetylglucosaminyl deacetylase